MATGRLIAINGSRCAWIARRTRARPASGEAQRDDDDENRPLNFSWRSSFPPANTLMNGTFWTPDSTAAEASVEIGWAKRYGVYPGDRITISVGEQEREFTVTSVAQGRLEHLPAELLRAAESQCGGRHPAQPAVGVPSAGRQRGWAGRAGARSPPLLDVDAVISQVRDVMERVAQAVQLVMVFSLLAGVLVLLAALQATAGERRYDSAVLRTRARTASCVARCSLSSAHARWPRCSRWARVRHRGGSRRRCSSCRCCRRGRAC